MVGGLLADVRVAAADRWTLRGVTVCAALVGEVSAAATATN